MISSFYKIILYFCIKNLYFLNINKIYLIKNSIISIFFFNLIFFNSFSEITKFKNVFNLFLFNKMIQPNKDENQIPKTEEIIKEEIKKEENDNFDFEKKKEKIIKENLEIDQTIKELKEEKKLKDEDFKIINTTNKKKNKENLSINIIKTRIKLLKKDFLKTITFENLNNVCTLNAVLYSIFSNKRFLKKILKLNVKKLDSYALHFRETIGIGILFSLKLMLKRFIENDQQKINMENLLKVLVNENFLSLKNENKNNFTELFDILTETLALGYSAIYKNEKANLFGIKVFDKRSEQEFEFFRIELETDLQSNLNLEDMINLKTNHKYTFFKRFYFTELPYILMFSIQLYEKEDKKSLWEQNIKIKEKITIKKYRIGENYENNHNDKEEADCIYTLDGFIIFIYSENSHYIYKSYKNGSVFFNDNGNYKEDSISNINEIRKYENHYTKISNLIYTLSEVSKWKGYKK